MLVFALALATSMNSAALIKRWDGLNTECRGDSHLPTDQVCRQRDAVEAQLRRAGWCWAYSDWRVLPAQYRWHRCGIARPA